jgi:hypothetical protein
MAVGAERQADAQDQHHAEIGHGSDGRPLHIERATV